MAHAVEDRPTPGGRPQAAPPASLARRGFFHLGELLLTLGVVVLLFVVYEVWITNIWADRNNDRNISALQHEFDTVLGLPGNANSSIPIGKALGILYIPRLGRDYAEAIVQGSTVPDDDQLEQGAAHYGNTQLPGQKGNFAIAGHRVGKGEPFLNIDQLRSGDKVIVETLGTSAGKRAVVWYVYQVLGSPPGGDPQTDTPGTVHASGGRSFPLHGRQIIDPSDGDVLYPVPNHPTIPASDAVDQILTMTTCHPKFTASHRMIIFAGRVTALTAVSKAPDARTHNVPMPASIEKLYEEVKV